MRRHARLQTRDEAVYSRHVSPPNVREQILKFEHVTCRSPMHVRENATCKRTKVRKSYTYKSTLVQKQIRKFEGITNVPENSVGASVRKIEDSRKKSERNKQPIVTKVHRSRSYVAEEGTGRKEDNKTFNRRPEKTKVQENILKFEEIAHYQRTEKSREFVYDTEEIKDQPIALIRERFLGNEKLKYQPSFRSDEDLRKWKEYANKHEAKVRENIRKFEELNIQQLLAKQQTIYHMREEVNVPSPRETKSKRKPKEPEAPTTHVTVEYTRSGRSKYRQNAKTENSTGSKREPIRPDDQVHIHSSKNTSANARVLGRDKNTCKRANVADIEIDTHIHSSAQGWDTPACALCTASDRELRVYHGNKSINRNTFTRSHTDRLGSESDIIHDDKTDEIMYSRVCTTGSERMCGIHAHNDKQGRKTNTNVHNEPNNYTSPQLHTSATTQHVGEPQKTRTRFTVIPKDTTKECFSTKSQIPKININIRKFEKLAILKVNEKQRNKPNENQVKRKSAAEKKKVNKSVVQENVMKFEILNLHREYEMMEEYDRRHGEQWHAVVKTKL